MNDIMYGLHAWMFVGRICVYLLWIRACVYACV